MGAKTVENIKASIAFLESSGGRLPIGIAQKVADRFVLMMESLDGTIKVAYAGSLRRGQESIGDIDILIATKNPDEAREAFTTSDGVMQVLAKGETKSSIRTAIGESNSRWGTEEGAGVQVDLRIVPIESWGSALMYFTGSTLNALSLMGLMLSVGMVVDNSIVVVENIHIFDKFRQDVL